MKVSFQSVLFFYVDQLLKHCRVDCGPSFQWTEMKRVCSHLCLFSSFAHICDFITLAVCWVTCNVCFCAEVLPICFHLRFTVCFGLLLGNQCAVKNS